MKHVPNTLTIIRFLLIPLLCYFTIEKQYVTALVIFLIAGFTDIADGFIARKFKVESDFGKLMDPLADKLVQISMILILTIQGVIPMFVILILTVKEICLILGATFLYEKNVVVTSNWYGKLSTILLHIVIILTIIFSILEQDNKLLLHIAIGIALISTIFSLVMYSKNFLAVRAKRDTDKLSL